MSVYMHVTLQTRYGQTGRLSELIEEMLPKLEPFGWKLIAAYQPVIGDLTQVIDVWELPSADCVGADLAKAAEDPQFARIATELNDILLEEHLQIVAKTSYSP